MNIDLGISSDEIITCAEERSMMDGRSFRLERRMCGKSSLDYSERFDSAGRGLLDGSI